VGAAVGAAVGSSGTVAATMWMASWAGMGVGLAVAPLVYFIAKNINKKNKDSKFTDVTSSSSSSNSPSSSLKSSSPLKDDYKSSRVLFAIRDKKNSSSSSPKARQKVTVETGIQQEKTGPKKKFGIFNLSIV
jgi:hypothetical protein